MVPLAVWYEQADLQLKAEALAEQLKLPLEQQASLQVWVSEVGLGLTKPGFSPIIPDFGIKTWEKRRQAGKKQGLVKACNPQAGKKILDVCAGWGRDAAILASFGAEVTMVERNPIMAVILEDALQRQDAESRLRLQLSLVSMDALVYLEHLHADQVFSVIYMDPMHPERQKSALVKKDLQVLQQLIGADEDALSLLNLAIEKTAERVVVKWPQGQQSLKPAVNCIAGKTVKFDIYS